MTSLSTRNFNKKDGIFFILCLVLWTLLLTGCEGPSTTVLPNAPADEDDESVQLSFVIPGSSIERLSHTVDILYTGRDDDTGPSDEPEAATDPAVYIVSALRNCSYDVNQTGEIIEAVLKAANDDPDICLVIACYGGSDAGTCASETAAGAAVLLETAEVLSEFSGDTEIHFVFLPGGRNDVEHIYTYLNEVFTPDPDRLLGAVIMGGLGLNPVQENEMGCEDGRATFMAEEINRICLADLGSECRCTASSEGVQNALLRNLIPSVVYRQRENAEAGTVLDCPSLIDYDYLQGSADIISRTLAFLLGDTTPSMLARAHYTDAAVTEGRADFAWQKNDTVPFGESEASLESVTGLVGDQRAENIVNGGRELLGYRFSMKWFGDDRTLPADFYYLSDSLQSVQIRAFEEGRDFDDMYREIRNLYGEASETSEGPYGKVYDWILRMQRLRITLQPQKEGYELSLTEYDPPVLFYPRDSLGCSRLKGLFEQVIPAEDREDIGFEAYTDGYGATSGRLTEASSDPKWMMGLDLDDALTEAADYKDRKQTLGELIRLYGEYLVQEDPELYYNDYHSRYGGDAEDFASSFRLFCLAGEPDQEAGPAADPVRYFYNFDELKSFRDTVRDIR